MRNSILFSVLGVFLSSGIASADPALQAEDAKPPSTGTVTPLLPDSKNPSCGPIGYSRTDRDLAPGRGQRVAGGMLIGLGLATLVPGAAMLGWSNNYDPAHDQAVDNLHEIKVGGGVATAMGVASIIAGIPVLALGIHNGKKARNERLTFAPSLAPTLGGARASVGGTF